MILLIRFVAALHLIVYLAIIRYGWQSYRLLRKPSWKVMGFGFAVLLLYRIRQLVKQLIANYPLDAETTILPFIGAILLLVAFWMMRRENLELIRRFAEPFSPRSGAQSVEYWLDHLRQVVREENTIQTQELKASK